MTRDEVICKSVKEMRDKGVTAIKGECEGQLDRLDEYGSRDCESCSEGTVECWECEGSCTMTCPECDGSGVMLHGEDEVQCDFCEGSQEVPCSSCDGQGERTCGYCDGAWQGDSSEGWANSGVCLRHILETLGRKFGQPIMHYSDDDDEAASHVDPFDWLHYIRFYNDGSVDSEMTFTVPIAGIPLEQAVENVKKLIEMPKAFSALADDVGNGLDVRGAGMHLAVIFDENYDYPSYGTHPSNRQMRNFQRSMTQLLPALYFLGANSNVTRRLEYRRPSVGFDTHRSAIDFRDGAVEFRVFDTCYDKPEVIIDDVIVMANCLRYLSDTYKNPNLDKICDEVTFGNDRDHSLDRFYQTTTHIDLLNAGLQRIKPADVTLTQLKAERQFKVTKRSFGQQEREMTKKAIAAYREYVERFEWTLMYRREDFRGQLIRDFVSSNTMTVLSNTDRRDKLNEIETEVDKHIKRIEADKNTSDGYVKQFVEQWKSELGGQYTLHIKREES